MSAPVFTTTVPAWQKGKGKWRLHRAIANSNYMCGSVQLCGGLSDTALAPGRKSSTPCQNHPRPGLATVPWAQMRVKEKREKVEKGKGKGKAEEQWGRGEDARFVLRAEPPLQCWELLSAGGTGATKAGLGEV